jgi:PIN domain nuclease of toxin-antitoxin system
VKVLLDTCTFLWVIDGAAELSTAAQQVFVDPTNEVYLSAVSVWEITIKHGLGRLPLPETPDRLIPKMRVLHGIQALPLDEEATFSLLRLPPLHRDPFDRMLVCQAIHHALTLLTPDPEIQSYPVRSIW